MSSKYDVVKLKVHLSDVHYYVLSRFLLSKMLMFCRIPEDAAVRISLDVKKHFVNNEQTSITQAELEDYLCSAILRFGFSEANTRLYPVVTQFNRERIPLIILLAGPACMGKTTLAHLLSARLNCSTIINTEVLRDINASIDDFVSASGAGSASPGTTAAEADTQVVAAVSAEMTKALREGKAIIIEGEQLRLAPYASYLTAPFQSSAGAVIVGVLVDAIDRPGAAVCAEDGTPVADLKVVYKSQNVCVSHARIATAAAAEGANRGGERSDDALFVARCTSPDDNLELSLYLHDVVVQRITDELAARGRLPRAVPPPHVEAPSVDLKSSA